MNNKEYLHGTSLIARLIDDPPVQVDNPIKIGDLTFRDGHQSLFATRAERKTFFLSPKR